MDTCMINIRRIRATVQPIAPAQRPNGTKAVGDPPRNARPTLNMPDIPPAPIRPPRLPTCQTAMVNFRAGTATNKRSTPPSQRTKDKVPNNAPNYTGTAVRTKIAMTIQYGRISITGTIRPHLSPQSNARISVLVTETPLTKYYSQGTS